MLESSVESAKRGRSLTFHNDIPPSTTWSNITTRPKSLKEPSKIVSNLLVDRSSSFLEDARRCGEGGPGAARKKFPCRGGESIRRRSTSTLSNRRLDIPYSSLPPSSVRAYNYRRHANPGTLLARERKGEGEAYDFSFSRLYSAFSPPLSFTFGLRGRIPIPGRRLDLPRARVPTPSSYTTPCWRSHGAPLPYDFHVSASGPPKLHDQALYLT